MVRSMGYTTKDVLRISPRYKASDWNELDQHSPSSWEHAANILEDRLNGRFLRFATNLLTDEFSGFAVLAIDCLLIETIEQFRKGITNGRGRSKALVTAFLSDGHFQPDFTTGARDAFYKDIRCGLLHQAEAKRLWLVRREQECMLQGFPDGDGFIIDVEKFHGAVKLSFQFYLKAILLICTQN